MLPMISRATTFTLASLDPNPKPRCAEQARHLLTPAVQPTSPPTPGSLRLRARRGRQSVRSLPLRLFRHLAALGCRQHSVLLTYTLPIGFTSCADTPLCSLPRVGYVPLADLTSVAHSLANTAHRQQPRQVGRAVQSQKSKSALLHFDFHGCDLTAQWLRFLHIPLRVRGASRNDAEGGGGSSQTAVKGKPLNKPLNASLSVCSEMKPLQGRD